MTRPRGWFPGAALSLVLLATVNTQAQGDAHAKQDNSPPPTSVSTKPGAAQESLAKLAGDYTRVIKFLGAAGAGIAPSSGTAKISSVLGGRFLLEESTDTVMGRTVDGLRLYGYNNDTKQYEMVRTYTMSTAMTMMTGTTSDGGKTIDFVGSTDAAGKAVAPLHAQFRVLSDDNFIVTLSTIGDDGKDAPFQSTEYARKK
jgi:Protein of unknown function (DUF1579)